ncbi:hypothetical protein Ciccas_006394 [Cichlidogyrus casuarinus]|uniref:UDP-glucose 4-epimerase n=1 Tax=Cichlidogyrus casuarinus TaxID=1844966 RepID=A0ABD2Q6W7_9PLAT
MDLKDYNKLLHIFQENKISFVIHFAALKAVGESILMPLEYYENNIGGMINLLKAMRAHNVKKLVFSSSCCVYTERADCPLMEDSEIGIGTNPYGTTKFICETLLHDLMRSDPEWSIVMLRYFNPVGAHKSALIGEDPTGIPKNLMPYITKVAYGILPQLNVFGDDYPTPDGTGVRDYIHIVDLSKGHVKAIDKLAKPGCYVYNLGTGKGTSVLELVKMMEQVSNKKVPYKIEPRRAGDLAERYCDTKKAEKELNWIATKSLKEMCEDAWRWQTQNPKGLQVRRSSEGLSPPNTLTAVSKNRDKCPDLSRSLRDPLDLADEYSHFKSGIFRPQKSPAVSC